jgi:hypothetical protein
MKRIIWTAAVWAAVGVTSVHAQTAIGIANSRSNSAALSRSSSTAIGGGNATGGQAVATGGNVNIAGAPAQTASTTTTTLNGHQRIDTTPQISAPGLTSSFGSCLGSVSGGGAVTGFGLTFGGTIEDRGCTARQNAQLLWNMNLRQMAVGVMCEQESVRYANPAVCQQYLPQVQSAAAGPGPIFGGPAYNPAGPPPVVMQASETEQAEIDKLYVPGTPINLIDGKTGKERVCYEYNVKRHLCRMWAKN